MQRGGYAVGLTGKERGTWCPDRQRKLFQLCNWRRLARYTVCEKETLCPTAEFPYLRLRQAGDDRCEQHGSIHETSAVSGKDQVSTRITRCPVGVARARYRAIVENEGSGAESPGGIRNITEITDHLGSSIRLPRSTLSGRSFEICHPLLSTCIAQILRSRLSIGEPTDPSLKPGIASGPLLIWPAKDCQFALLKFRSTEVQSDSGGRVQIAQLVGVADATINFAWYALRLCVNSISPDALAPFAVPGILLRR
jgi:hypothetical protein